MGLGKAIITGPHADAHAVAKVVRRHQAPVRGSAGRFEVSVDCSCVIPRTNLCAGCGARVRIHVIRRRDDGGWKAAAWGRYTNPDDQDLNVAPYNAVPIIISPAGDIT